MRSYKLYLEDILVAIKKIDAYSRGLTLVRLKRDKMVIDAIVRNLEIIGEASKNIPNKIRDKSPDIEWKKICGLRDILAHEYFGVDVQILWDIIRSKLPDLKKKITRLLKSI
jgi:uncharacterized protein with HEPN domain